MKSNTLPKLTIDGTIAGEHAREERIMQEERQAAIEKEGGIYTQDPWYKPYLS